MRNLFKKIRCFFSRLVDRMAEAEAVAMKSGVFSTAALSDCPALC